MGSKVTFADNNSIFLVSGSFNFFKNKFRCTSDLPEYTEICADVTDVLVPGFHRVFYVIQMIGFRTSLKMSKVDRSLHVTLQMYMYNVLLHNFGME